MKNKTSADRAAGRNSTVVSIVEITNSGGQLAAVLVLSRLHRQWLGFLPDEAFTDRL